MDSRHCYCSTRCPVCEDGKTDPAALRIHANRCSCHGERSYPLGRYVPRPVAIPKPERPAEWLNREFGAFAPALAGRVTRGER